MASKSSLRIAFSAAIAASFWGHAAASSGAGANAFLSSRTAPMTDLLHELERVAGADHRQATERRAVRLENALRPMYNSMPKDSAGNLHATSVRYLLHRLFVQRHGWFVNGLETAGEAWNSSSPTKVFESHVEGEVHDLFHGRLSNDGFSLHQVAVFAATLEVLVHEESLQRLENAYRLWDLPHGATVSEADAIKAIDTYMLLYVLDLNHTKVTKAEFQDASDNILEIYPTWPDTQDFVRGVRDCVLIDVHGQERDSWNNTLHVLEEVGERYGRWQDKECRVLKDELVKMDEDADGRVPLEKFYANAITNSSWQFVESVPYLRQLGALDENDPQRLAVIIPNYLNSPSNCVASSKFYAVCCIDECEALLGSLESHIGAPDASPTLIVQLVSGLPSSTVAAPRQLGGSLLARLDEIAAHHGGQVPLHGRLFYQWLHHAFPRECPYPHLSGSTKPLTAQEFYKQFGDDVEVSHDQIWEIMNKTAKLQDDRKATGQPLPWTAEEELFVHRHAAPSSTLAKVVASILRWLMLLLAFGSVGWVILGLAKPCSKGMIMGNKGEHKYYV